MYVLRRRGPRTESQGTPCLTISQLEQKFYVFEDFVSTFCFLLYKYDLNQIKISPYIQQYFSFNSKGLWFAQSGAFTKLQEIPEMYIFFFHALKIEIVNLYKALSVDKPFQNPHCWGANTWWAQKYWFIPWS